MFGLVDFAEDTITTVFKFFAEQDETKRVAAYLTLQKRVKPGTTGTSEMKHTDSLVPWLSYPNPNPIQASIYELIKTCG